MCKYYLPCGMCELTKEKCKNINRQYVPQWNPGPATCDSDTFKIHPESGFEYNCANISVGPQTETRSAYEIKEVKC